MKLRSHIPNDWLSRLALAVLVLAPFSFAPSVALPLYGFVSFRLGLYQLLVVVFVVCGLWLVRTELLRQFRQNRWLQLLAVGFGLVFINSVVFTQDLQRTLLMSASVGLLLTATLAMYLYLIQLSSDSKRRFVTSLKFWLITAGTVVSVIGIIQFILGSIDQSLIADGLCDGCQASVFGFPRINGFAIEPQFFASALIPALLASLVNIFKSSELKLRSLLPGLIITVAFALSFSRGANLALASGLAVLAIQLLRTNRLKKLLRIAAVVTGGYLLAATAMVGSNYLQFHDKNPSIVAETFETIVEHGSAGVIELKIRDNNQSSGVNEGGSSSNLASQNFTPPQQIKASGDERLEAARTGVKLLDNPRRLLFGVGLGNLGPQAIADGLTVPADLTIYIQYALVVVEAGLVGLMLFIALHLAATAGAWRALNELPDSALWLAAALVAFMVQYLSFGTYINAVYIWLYVGLGLAISVSTAENRMLEWKP